jgi:integrase
MYGTGMRPGEIVALRWSDIDFVRKMIHVSKTRLRNEDGQTKTKASTRYVDLLPIAENALKMQQEQTGTLEHVFVNSSQKPFYSHDVIGVNFQRILKKTGIKARPLYNIRHTFASQLISKGADIVWVSKMLGHKDVSITLKIYTKFIEENDEVRLKKIEKMGTVMGTLDNASL